jgi:hypothetical protein
LELHSNARFARQHKEAEENAPKPRPSGGAMVLLWAHNLIYWFFLIPFVTPMSYRAGFSIYAGILLFRFLANTWINLRNFSWQQYFAYPFRIP